MQIVQNGTQVLRKHYTDHVRRKHATYLQQPSTDSTLAESTKSDTPVTVKQCTHTSQQSLSTLLAAKLPRVQTEQRAFLVRYSSLS